ncbi:MAG: hypothetical protein ACE5JX_16035 [Acidobacteriota bacterium]
MNQVQPDKTLPVLIGGTFLGVTSALPLLQLLNCACCMLVLSGGILASFMYVRKYPPHLPQPTFADGALLGALAGAVGAVVDTLVEIPLSFIKGHILGLGFEDELGNLLANQDIPPALRNLLEGMISGGFSLGLILVGFLFSLVIFTLFGAIGGVVGIALFGKRQPNIPPPQTAPPPSTPQQ